MVALTVTTHFFGLLGLTWVLRRRGGHFRAHESVVGRGALVLFLVFGIFAVHTVEIWLYAALYWSIHAIGDFETALYFATVTFVSLGYGDVVLKGSWRLLSAIEGANGVLLVAWSTAFLLSVVQRLRDLEHDWLEPKR